MKKLKRIAVALVALAVAACAGIEVVAPSANEAVKACRATCEKQYNLDHNFAQSSLCLLKCEGATPRPTPTLPETPSPTPTAMIVPTATVAPDSEPVNVWTEIKDTPCFASDTVRSVFDRQVRTAQQAWLDANPDKWRWHSVLPSVSVAYIDTFYFGVAANLRAAGLDAVVDSCRCGELAVSASGMNFHEQYHVLISNSGGVSWDVHWPLTGGDGSPAAGFKARCEPRGFGGQATATPPPTPAPLTVCPPLLRVGANPKHGTPRFQGDEPGKFCWSIDMNPKLDLDGTGKEYPCDKAKWKNCGVAGGGVDAAGNQIPDSGDLCEPAPDSLLVEYRSAGWNANDTGYAGRVCGPEGSPYTVTVRLKPGAVDKAGRLLDLSRFGVDVLQGAI